MDIVIAHCCYLLTVILPAMYNGPPTDVRISPALAQTHTGLPPAYFQIMECDPLRDEGMLYERLLRDAGCETKLVRSVLSNLSFLHGAFMGSQFNAHARATGIRDVCMRRTTSFRGLLLRRR